MISIENGNERIPERLIEVADSIKLSAKVNAILVSNKSKTQYCRSYVYKHKTITEDGFDVILLCIPIDSKRQQNSIPLSAFKIQLQDFARPYHQTSATFVSLVELWRSRKRCKVSTGNDSYM